MFSSAGREEMIYFYRASPILDCLVCPLAPLVCQCPLSAKSGPCQVRAALIIGEQFNRCSAEIQVSLVTMTGF